MALIFKPNGLLDVATDPADLPSQNNNGVVYSEALTRLKNLRMDRKGLVTLRDGSSKVNSATFLSLTVDAANFVVEQGGVRYALAGAAILRNESTLTSGLTDAQWSAIKYNAFNDTTQQVFALNGTDRKRIEGSSVFEWGIEPPSAPTVTIGTTVEYVYAYSWETSHVTGEQFTLDDVTNLRGYLYTWELLRDSTSDTKIIALFLFEVGRQIEGKTAETLYAAPPVSGTLTGDYVVKITYCRKVGSVVVAESNPSEASAVQQLTRELLRVSWSASSDAQVTHVRVYRTLANGSSYYHDSDVTIGTVSVDTGVQDGELGNAIETDHDRPPLGSFVSGPAYDGTCFIVKDNLLYYCKPKQPEYWPALYYMEVSPPQLPGKCPIVFYNGQPYFFTQNEIYQIIGTGHGNFLPIPVNAKTGAQGGFGALSVKGKGIYHTGPDGIYLFAGEDVKITESRFEPLFRNETVNGMPGIADMATAILHRFGNNLYFAYTSSGNDYPTNVLVFNLDTNRTSYFNYNDGSAIAFRCMATDETNNRLLIGDNAGFIRQIENKNVTDDSGAAISWEVESMQYTLQTRRHFPRWAKYDVDASSAASAIGQVIIDGVSVQSHTLSEARNVKYRHVASSNGNRCSTRISGTGPISVYAVELE